MYSFEFEYIIRQFDESILNKGIYLSVVHANKIPPHIGVVVDGRYFSLKAKGKDVDVPIKDFIKIINRKQIVSLFIQIPKNISSEQISTIYQRFTKAKAYESSCLTPIKHIFELGEEIQKLGDLLKVLDNSDLIASVYGINVPDEYRGIPAYDVNAIHQRLEILATKSKQHV
jgi:hypothetical protein